MWRRDKANRPSSPAVEPETAPAPGLADRDALEQAVLALAASDDPRRIFVAAFGLDRFDRIRAAFGYDCICDLMSALAERIGAGQAGWSCARVSDDVIAAAFQATDEAEATRLVEGARARAQGPSPIGAHTIDVRLTLGLSAAGPPRALVREADMALDAARVADGGFAVFDPCAHAAVADALSLMPELRQAIAWGQLSLAHQPKYDMRTSAVTGLECLVRWTHPQRGAISPATFVPLAEETGDIAELTRWVVERALLEQVWLEQEGFVLPFAVNLSGRLVGDAAFMDWLIARLRGLRGRLQLEITETGVIDNPSAAFANVRRLAAAGIGCSIDDYGAGLSSLAYLKQIEATELKLDKSVVDEVTRSRRDMLVTRSTVDLAHSLGMKVVAEGIEDGETAAVLAAMGCDIGQGYAFCRPVPLTALVSFLREAGGAAQKPISRAPSEKTIIRLAG